MNKTSYRIEQQETLFMYPKKSRTIVALHASFDPLHILLHHNCFQRFITCLYSTEHGFPAHVFCNQLKTYRYVDISINNLIRFKYNETLFKNPFNEK